MMDDAELLRRYAADHAEDAFAELVRRHLGLVYSVALRRVGGDTQLAEDVAQKVFADLARKAASLRGHVTLGGWLYVSAHFTSAAVVRSERRRKTRETEAQTMQSLLNSSASEPDWHHLRPVLDEVIVGLRDDEREAIALRFFEKQTFAEVGATLRLTEEAARKRVARALEKLRSVLARRGITSTTAMLTLALAELGVTAVPTGLTAKIAGHALAQGGAAGTGITFGAWLTSGMFLASAALLVGTFAVSYEHRTNRRLETELANLAVEPGAVAALRAENQRLARVVAEADDLQRLQAEPPPLPATSTPAALAPPALAPAQASITVQSDGTMRWGSERVTLDQFLARLRALRGDLPGGETKVAIKGLSNFSSLAWVIDEVAKGEITHVVVDSNTQPDPKFGFSWFVWQ